ARSSASTAVCTRRSCGRRVARYGDNYMADAPPQEPYTLDYRSGRDDRPGVFDIILTTLAALACFFGAFLLGFLVVGLMIIDPPQDVRPYYLFIAIPLFGGSALAAAAKGIRLLVSLFRRPGETVEPADDAGGTVPSRSCE